MLCFPGMQSIPLPQHKAAGVGMHGSPWGAGPGGLRGCGMDGWMDGAALRSTSRSSHPPAAPRGPAELELSRVPRLLLGWVMLRVLLHSPLEPLEALALGSSFGFKALGGET